MRQGDVTEILLARNSDALTETWGDERVKHASLRALFASDRYGNLRDWAAKQTALLEQGRAGTSDLIRIHGQLNDAFDPVDADQVDDALCERQRTDSTRVLLIDGPAGIGKTQFIETLSWKRAASYVSKRRPLILHVQSRGRTLSYLYDMMAYSLQRVRSNVTFDQVPVLAKYGLITLAIDGFDELADPDGYGNAWAQVSDLVETLRGSGSIILAGRETFIGRDRVLKDIATLRSDKDDLNVLTLLSPSKGTAVQWLIEQGWQDDQIRSIEDYLEPNSLALRPFFLATLANPEIAEMLSTSKAASVLSILMEAMIEREVGKFGDAVNRMLNAAERRQYIVSLLGEAARDMAEANSSSISDGTLSWLVDVALPRDIEDSVVRILKARSHALAFFTNDDRRSYKRFYHEKFYEYFLSLSAIDMVTQQQSGRILSRNILGSSFLETFGDVVGTALPEPQIKDFCEKLMDMLKSYPPIDRTRKNLGALVIASFTVAEFYTGFGVVDVDLDECRMAGTASGGLVANILISQLDCRGANLSNVRFDNARIVSTIADRDTVLPDSFPLPDQIRDVSGGAGTIFAPAARTDWVRAHLDNPPVEDQSLIPGPLRQHAAIRLLQKTCRTRQHWLRRSDDIYAAKILNDYWWPTLERLLLANGLLTVEIRGASGTDGRFLHVRRGEEILAENADDSAVCSFYADLIAELVARPS